MSLTKQISVAMLPRLLPSTWNDKPDLAVVIDTLRFTTTACQALHAGAKSIAVARTIEDSLQLKSLKNNSLPPLLCGERHCRRIDGFDLGNSPYEYLPANVGGRDLVFTTTNGTIAVHAVQSAAEILLGSIVNRSAIARVIANSPISHIWIVCSGTDGEIAVEDVCTAGAIIEAVTEVIPVEFANDSSQITLAIWQSQRAGLSEMLKNAKGGSNLIDNGFGADLDFATKIDSLSIVPHSRPKSDNRFYPRAME